MTSTSENYRQDHLKFHGPFAKFRELCDYSYHVNYSRRRQAWQDEAIKSVISRAVEQPAPWLVYTCGPMGVGKAGRDPKCGVSGFRYQDGFGSVVGLLTYGLAYPTLAWSAYVHICPHWAHHAPTLHLRSAQGGAAGRPEESVMLKV